MSDIVLVTGASGFLGRCVSEYLLMTGAAVRTLTRSPLCIPGIESFCYTGPGDVQQMNRAVRGATAVIHLAARVHVLRDRSLDPLHAYRHVNVWGTQQLAQAACEAGVRDFLLASSVKAMGESNTRNWTEDDIPRPVGPYGISKLEAEHVIGNFGDTGVMNTAALRLPLIYGAGMKANMLSLFQFVDRGLPAPVGGIRNRRSFVYVRNAAHAFVGLLGRIRGSEVFLISDNQDISTPDLVMRIAHALERPARIVAAPVKALHLAQRLRIPGAAAISDRLLGSLTVDPTRLLRRLSQPFPYSLDQGLAETGAWYRHKSKQVD